MPDRRELAVLADALEGVAEVAETLGRFRSMLELGGDIFDRDSYMPGHVTASAFVTHPVEPAILLVHHHKLDMWVQPGGHVEATDPGHEAAARREVREETGVTEMVTLGVVDLDIHTFPARESLPAHLHFDLRWAFRACDAEISTGDGVREVRWVLFDEAMRMDPSIARPVRRLSNFRSRPSDEWSADRLPEWRHW